MTQKTTTQTQASKISASASEVGAVKGPIKKEPPKSTAPKTSQGDAPDAPAQPKQTQEPTAKSQTPQPQSAVQQTPSETLTFGKLFPDSDIIFFNGPIDSNYGNQWHDNIDNISPKENVLVFMCTCGGDADDAFRMMRLLQMRYKTIHVFVFGECYSAGTIFALGADCIYMTDNAQLGPLDVQLRKDDELFRMSGECYQQTLQNLSANASAIFMEQFTKLKLNASIPISTATASRVASAITVGLLSPVTRQIEPSKLGEVLRAQNIGAAYGRRLMIDKYPSPIASNIVRILACNYSSHSTVIDYREAKRIGLHVKLFDVKRDFGGKLAQISHHLLTQSQVIQFQLVNDKSVEETDLRAILC